MKLIEEKYRRLKPTIDYLTDEVVMAQAWKKTHGYIRTFNWYADTLALDVSALGIEDNAKIWAKSLKDGKALHPLELVPAAKSEAWVIDAEGWHPSEKSDTKRDDEKIPLRPLAHLTIRDQTWASAAMLCLADAVESAQGDCSHKKDGAEGALARRVYSYGNRLICDWKASDKAWFRWGNSETYRKFYTDYQNFLKRPITTGRVVSEQQADEESVFIVNLDLAKFYNTIKRETLSQRLQEISKNFKQEVCPDFWQAFERITDWQWSADDVALAEKHKMGAIEQGLPQGLVAAGFFANAYLVDFDRKFGELIGSSLDSTKELVLHDYCRYVDDLRLVVSTDEHSAEEIADLVNACATQLLKRYGGDELAINEDKTKVTPLPDLDNSGSMAKRIETIQSELSGPADRDMLDSATGILESLLTVEDDQLPSKTVIVDQPLLQITGFDHDIRPDTLKRFAANRLESIVRSKRKLTLGIDGDGSANFENTDNESELLAKKLILAWMRDPSLGLVLRKALEIYPCADLFEPVLKAIYRRSSFSEEVDNEHTAAMMDYLLADLFRCAADFNGYFQVVDYPSSLTPHSVIELISRYAQKVIASGTALVFVKRQALMLLAVINKPVLEKSSEELLQHHQFLHRLLAGSLPDRYQRQFRALFEVAGQITGNFDTYAADFMAYIADLDGKQYAALEVFAKRGGPFWLSLWKQLKKPGADKPLLDLFRWATPQVGTSPAVRLQRLAKVIASESNGFEHESALIKLGLGLIDLIEHGKTTSGRSPTAINVKPDSPFTWDKLYLPGVTNIVCTAGNGPTDDPRFVVPDWLAVDLEDTQCQKIYWLGSILRAAALGGADFTGSRWKAGKTVTYKGLRTSWYKRRMGMMHAPEALVGEYSTLSTWTSELLMRCLQWPGFESSHIRHDDIKAIVGLKTLKQCLATRLTYLNELYCKSSQLPLIPTIVKRPKQENDRFRVVTVQQLLPRYADFSLADPELNNPVMRSRHRAHLLDVCALTVKTLEAKLKADKEDPKPKADLIVFPEVAVHPDDQDVIKRLADKTQAIVFAGLVFTDHQGVRINKARWFIPDYRDTGRQWIIRDQGKEFMTKPEKGMGITGYRPCQHLIELVGHPEGPFTLTGAICYDATDINLVADLRGKTDLFVIAAHNRDVNTFDNMAAALQYHMYQHVVITNIGEFGGSTIQAPYKEPYDKLIAHSHGGNQISISTADIDLAAFKRKIGSYKKTKTKPAGMS
ncbi:RNA-directed DNA polymerase [Marinobacterium rhizophilum]|uniref:RNA-directed DNA polymerase n=1 Tax=Marinobacterium rhizophilum TaxID=420402 RepID=UPI00036ECC2B|nr:RNA-directed DNA polymerase [Marinobacterium rhizophilum]